MTTTTNTNGVIAAAAQTKPQEAPAKATPAQMLNSLLNNGAIQQTLKSTLDKNAGAFAASVMNLFNSDTLLQQCEPRAVLAEALKAAALKLPVEKQLGFAYIIPYKDHGVPKPQFQLGYKGYIQLAIRSGQYKKLIVLPIKQGELIHFNPLEEDIEVQLIENEIDRENAPTIGYYAMFEYINGFKKAIYWSKEKMESHAEKYSKGYQKRSGYTFWEKDFDGMACKTMLRQLISKWGIMSIEMEKAVTNDMAVINEQGEAEYVETIPETGEVIETEEVVESVTTEQPPLDDFSSIMEG